MFTDSVDAFEMPDLPPEADLITGPVGCGKTAAAIDAILDTRLFAAFSTIWVLLATDRQIHAFRERLLARSPDGVQFGVEFFNFYTLYGRLLDMAGDPQRQVSDAARYNILRAITTTLQARGELELFGEIAHLSGFIGLAAGLINELKQGLVLPEDFEQVAAARGPKDRDLARIYSGYQRFLQDRHLVDRHGAGWLAVEHLQTGGALGQAIKDNVELLVVDGFDQFNRVHVQLLTALARQVKRTVLTLTRAPGDQGRRFRRFEQTRERLLDADCDLWRERWLDGPGGSEMDRPPALDHLSRAIFHSQPDRLPNGGALALIEAPDVVREVEAVLRRVKALLLDGIAPESVIIIARRLDRYGGALYETARAFGLPLVVRAGGRLEENPAVALVLLLIDLVALDFPRRELLDVLRSPYVDPPDLSPEQIAQLERISLDRQVVRGRAIWLDAVTGAGRVQQDEDGEALRALAETDAVTLVEALAGFFDRITPPLTGTIYDLTGWIEALIGPDPEAEAHDQAEAQTDDTAAGEADEFFREHLDVLANVRASGDAVRVARDVSALAAFKQVLLSLRAAHDLLVERGDLALIRWADFRAELELALDRAAITPPGGQGRLGRVLATDALEARGLPHDHVFILGLSESVFPEQQADDPLYQEDERQQLEAAGIDVQTADERVDDMSLFYQAVGLARRSLTLSRFTVDDRGTPNPPSPFWGAVRAVVDVPDDQITRLPVGAAPALDHAATPGEAAVAVAAAFSGERGDQDIAAAAGVYNALLDHPTWGARWRGALHGRAVEAGREDITRPFDAYGGILTDPALIAAAAAQLGPERIWSASQFTEYGVCPYRFFARRLLRLDELKEPEEGLDALQRGSLNHAVLEDTYRRIAGEGLSITPENQTRALAILQEVAAEVFEHAPEQFGFRPSPVWEHERADLLRRLGWLVALDFSDETPFASGKKPLAQYIADAERQPYAQEARFGFGGQAPVMIDGPAGPVRARGLIDRMDRAGDGVIVVDYKTGSTRHPVEDMAEGRDFQMMLYLLAAQTLLQQRNIPLRVIGGLFWHVQNRHTSGDVLAGDEAVEMARAWLHAHIQAARAGRFPVQPRKLERGGQCVSYCEFGPLCRVSRANVHKRED
ncbi:MAG: PD-(D/E)XK nuclease family protein [Anaerolineae bacterium]|nr:PD-(D/E)XK nuclease family protein [Anaerolineae bacterium]